MSREDLQTCQTRSEHPKTTGQSQTYLLVEALPRPKKPGAQKRRGCIRHAQIRAQCSDRCDIDCKNTQNHYYTPSKAKPLNSPVGAKSRRIGEAGGLGNVADGSTACGDMQSLAADAKMAKSQAEMLVHVRGGQGGQTHL